MAGQSSAKFGKSWTAVSVLGSRVFGQALMESCDSFALTHDGICMEKTTEFTWTNSGICLDT